MRKIIFILIALSLSVSAIAQRIAENTYWLYFTDKEKNGYTITQPEAFLSQRSIERRAWQNLPVDESDLPLSSIYLDSISTLNVDILYVSKWLNGVLVKTDQKNFLDSIYLLSFVDSVPWKPDIYTKYFPSPSTNKRFGDPLPENPEYHYGYSYEQLNQLHLPSLHSKGFTGKGVRIAICDAGFINLPVLPAFQAAITKGQIIDSRNFVEKEADIFYGHSHGTSVTSIIAAYWPDSLMGTAPDAELLLALTENPFSETRIEEYSWIEAAEWADSLGADIINTSLGYTIFDDSSTNYSYSDMDGKTAHISIANSMTASKGIISVTSAGNEGNSNWFYIGAPADATDILSVGAVNSSGNIANFSSHGPTYDHRIKPEVAAMGSLNAFQSIDSTVSHASGTSFSSPMIAGATAVLWQAYPSVNARDMMRWIMDSGDRSLYPDIHYGYGIPNFTAAYYAITSIESVDRIKDFRIYPNPFSSHINIDMNTRLSNRYTASLYDIQGRKVYEEQMLLPGRINLPESLLPGMYLLELTDGNINLRNRLIKFE